MPCHGFRPWAALGAASLMLAPVPAPAQGRVTGVGGIFIRSRDPVALMAWYRDVLGLAIEPWGGAMLRADAPGHPPVLTVTAFDAAAAYLAPSTREFMLNFAVDDMTAMLARLAAHKVAVLKRDDGDPHGRFAWIMDPDAPRSSYGNRKTPAPHPNDRDRARHGTPITPAGATG